MGDSAGRIRRDPRGVACSGRPHQASGFLLKDALAADLISAVRTVAAGEAVTAPAVTRRLIAHFLSGAAARADQQERLAVLTGREREVLTLIRGRSNAGPRR
jgi:DNA-binding NarL/FixJ family response regulator